MKRADEILARVLDAGNRKLAQSYSSAFSGWEQIVGQSLGEHSRIYEIANKNLFVEVDHPGWMQLLLMRKAQILRALKRTVPSLEIQDIRVKVNLSYSSLEPEEGESPVSENEGEDVLQEDKKRDIDQILSSVSQDELKRRLRSLFLKSLENETSRGEP